MSVSNKDFARRWVELFQCSDLATCLNACDDYISDDFRDAGAPEERGAAGVKAFMTELWKAVPDLTATIHTQVAEGGRVVTHKTLSGTHLGAFFGTPPSGEQVSIPVMDILTIENGKITAHAGVSNLGALTGRS